MNTLTMIKKQINKVLNLILHDAQINVSTTLIVVSSYECKQHCEEVHGISAIAVKPIPRRR